MADYQIAVEPRTVLGKGTKNLRNAGITPGVIYGKGGEATNIQVNAHDLAAIFRAGGKDGEIDVTLEGTTHTVIVQELQRHITRGDFIHIDFMLA